MDGGDVRPGDECRKKRAPFKPKDSGLRFGFEGARGWAAAHVERNPSHTAFREAVDRYWRATRK
ncbi:DUF7848 domain-containing protein [Streptomyces abikoensis]|uniref:DUF7848 domain-containing protein n=1 Tax=Streptomyces abikoensis TaxID=97398 RepID=A0ABW7T3M2_9ACTN